eukprot:Clim_evm9s43 gene=Clim_evmTU9s43
MEGSILRSLTEDPGPWDPKLALSAAERREALRETHGILAACYDHGGHMTFAEACRHFLSLRRHVGKHLVMDNSDTETDSDSGEESDLLSPTSSDGPGHAGRPRLPVGTSEGSLLSYSQQRIATDPTPQYRVHYTQEQLESPQLGLSSTDWRIRGHFIWIGCATKAVKTALDRLQNYTGNKEHIHGTDGLLREAHAAFVSFFSATWQCTALLNNFTCRYDPNIRDHWLRYAGSLWKDLVLKPMQQDLNRAFVERNIELHVPLYFENGGGQQGVSSLQGYITQQRPYSHLRYKLQKQDWTLKDWAFHNLQKHHDREELVSMFAGEGLKLSHGCCLKCGQLFLDVCLYCDWRTLQQTMHLNAHYDDPNVVLGRGGLGNDNGNRHVAESWLSAAYLEGRDVEESQSEEVAVDEPHLELAWNSTTSKPVAFQRRIKDAVTCYFTTGDDQEVPLRKCILAQSITLCNLVQLFPSDRGAHLGYIPFTKQVLDDAATVCEGLDDKWSIQGLSLSEYHDEVICFDDIVMECNAHIRLAKETAFRMLNEDGMTMKRINNVRRLAVYLDMSVVIDSCERAFSFAQTRESTAGTVSNSSR